MKKIILTSISILALFFFDRITKVFPTKVSDMKIEFEDLIIIRRKNKVEILSPK